jgi:hypothetical protein
VKLLLEGQVVEFEILSNDERSVNICCVVKTTLRPPTHELLQNLPNQLHDRGKERGDFRKGFKGFE